MKPNNALAELEKLWQKIPSAGASSAGAKKTKTKLLFQEGIENFSFDCSVCPKPCCENQAGINLLLKDVAVLKDNGLTDKIVGRYDPASKIAEFLEKSKCEKVPNEPGILHVADRCIFFSRGRCDIYPYRPLVCRTFPFILESAVSRDDCVYKLKVSSRCPFSHKIEEFHVAKEISPFIKGFMEAALAEQVECDRTLKLVAYYSQELRKISFSQYLAPE